MLGVVQHVQRAFIARPEPDLAVEARDRFRVVVQYFRFGCQHDVHGGVRALKVRDEHFDAAAGDALADGADGQGKELGSTVLAIVAVDAGDDGELKSQGGAGFGDPARFVVIHGQRPAFLDGAETAAPRADVAENHKGCRSLIPAFADIGTGSTFADRVEVEVGHQLFEFAVVLADRRGGAEPLRTGGKLRID